jgi:hypothetical protein
MLSEGKITVEEAQRLLETIGKSPDPAEQDPGRHRDSEPTSIMDNIVDTIRTGLSNLNFSFGDTNRIVLEERHSGRFTGERVELELTASNGSIRVDTWDEKEFRLDVIKKIRAGTREQAEAIVSGLRFADFDGQRLRAGDQECKGLGGKVYVSLRLWLPRNCIYLGKVTSKNGSIEITGIDMNGFDVRTVNGSVKLSQVTGDQVDAKAVNGSLRLEGGFNGIEAKTTNGSITLVNIATDSEGRLATVNGRIKVQLPIRPDLGIAVDARTTSGSVRLNHELLETRFEERRVGRRSLEASTANWKEAGHKIELHLRSVNGSIQIEELK